MARWRSRRLSRWGLVGACLWTPRWRLTGRSRSTPAHGPEPSCVMTAPRSPVWQGARPCQISCSQSAVPRSPTGAPTPPANPGASSPGVTPTPAHREGKSNMALEMDSWAVTGAQSSARIARLQHQSGTRSGNGVVDVDHLQVLPLEVPGTAVRITSGGATILGREMGFQGSYFAFNVGDAELDISPTGSGGGRVGMVVLRVEDPNIDGTSWNHDVTEDPVYYFRVIEDVGSNATEPPAGMTAIPLARIHIPASTATITSDMITDIRTPANPRNQRVLRVQRGGTMTDGTWDEAGNIVQ